MSTTPTTEPTSPLTAEDERRIAVLRAVTETVRARGAFSAAAADAIDVVHLANWVLGTFDPWAPETTVALPEPVQASRIWVGPQEPPAAETPDPERPPHVWAAGDIVRHRAGVEVRREGQPRDGWEVMVPLPGLEEPGTLVDEDGDLRIRRPRWVDDGDYTHARPTHLILETPAPVML